MSNDRPATSASSDVEKGLNSRTNSQSEPGDVDISDKAEQRGQATQDEHAKGTTTEAREELLHRKLKGRHMQMIAIGGSIGTGLFVGSGAALQSGGPASLVIGFVLIGVMLFNTVHGLGEMAVLFPVSGSFYTYSCRFIDPAWGYTMGINYALNWLTVLPLELTAAGITLQFWEGARSVPISVWITVFLVAVTIVNLFGVRGYGEVEYTLGAIKIIAVIGFIITAIIINCGGVPTDDRGYIGGRYWDNPGAFRHGFKGFCSVFVTAGFAFAGTELVGLAAAEADNPRKSLPTATKQVFWRISLFYIVGLTLVGLIVPSNDPRLLNAEGGNTAASPFVIALQLANINVLPSIFNGVITLAVLSVAVSCTYGSTRTLHALAEHGMIPSCFGYVDKHGRPMVALGLSLLFGCLAYINQAAAGDAIFNWLLALSGLSQFFTWASINLAHVRFRKAWKAQGYTLDEIPFLSAGGVIGSYIGFGFCILVLIAQFYVAVSPLDKPSSVENFFQNYLGAFILIPFYVGYKIWKRDWGFYIKLADVDLVTGRRELDLKETLQKEREERAQWPMWKRIWHLFYIEITKQMADHAAEEPGGSPVNTNGTGQRIVRKRVSYKDTTVQTLVAEPGSHLSEQVEAHQASKPNVKYHTSSRKITANEPVSSQRPDTGSPSVPLVSLSLSDPENQPAEQSFVTSCRGSMESSELPEGQSTAQKPEDPIDAWIRTMREIIERNQAARGPPSPPRRIIPHTTEGILEFFTDREHDKYMREKRDAGIPLTALPIRALQREFEKNPDAKKEYDELIRQQIMDLPPTGELRGYGHFHCSPSAQQVRQRFQNEPPATVPQDPNFVFTPSHRFEHLRYTHIHAPGEVPPDPFQSNTHLRELLMNLEHNKNKVEGTPADGTSTEEAKPTYPAPTEADWEAFWKKRANRDPSLNAPLSLPNHGRGLEEVLGISHIKDGDNILIVPPRVKNPTPELLYQIGLTQCQKDRIAAQLCRKFDRTNEIPFFSHTYAPPEVFDLIYPPLRNYEDKTDDIWDVPDLEELKARYTDFEAEIVQDNSEQEQFEDGESDKEPKDDEADAKEPDDEEFDDGEPEDRPGDSPHDYEDEYDSEDDSEDDSGENDEEHSEFYSGDEYSDNDNDEGREQDDHPRDEPKRSVPRRGKVQSYDVADYDPEYIKSLEGFEERMMEHYRTVGRPIAQKYIQEAAEKELKKQGAIKGIKGKGVAVIPKGAKTVKKRINIHSLIGKGSGSTSMHQSGQLGDGSTSNSEQGLLSSRMANAISSLEPINENHPRGENVSTEQAKK
ncbi:hypothetical protein Dda_5702 [Drechslerella dactyloides]|uniref:Amino acid permease/ SLC12A domain-containing protein n=1 Tax=Drechslerella dactyloides TaxID=74499 RepID=A0AAD6J0U1_DREDA|nr:hypothetical protein Dda_5702 [Drechslerella dactyloides]